MHRSTWLPSKLDEGAPEGPVEGMVSAPGGKRLLVIPIFEQKPTGSIGYSFPEFQKRFLNICAEHRSSGRALAFAFLLIDVDTPEFMKMLRDPDYWRALDHVAGRYLSVFTLMTRQPRFDHKRESRQLTGVGPVRDPGMKVQVILKSYFGLDGTIDLPAVLLFQVDEEKVSGYCLVQLRADAVEPAFNEVRELLRDLADAVGKSDSKGASDPQKLFDAIKTRLRKRKAVRVVKGGLKVLSELKDVVGLAGGVV